MFLRDPNLVHSVYCELREILKILANEGVNKEKCTTCMSWRFPTRTAGSIDSLKLLNDATPTSDNYYILLLELIIDRVHFILNSIVINIDVMKKTKVPQNVRKPQNLALSSILAMFWHRTNSPAFPIFMDFENKEKEFENIENKVKMSCAEVQTIKSSIVFCESCNVASEAIKELLKEIEKTVQLYSKDSFIALERQNIGEELFELSQWGAMQKWIKAMRGDLKILTVDVVDMSFRNQMQLEQEGAKLLDQNKFLEQKLEGSENLIKKDQLAIESLKRTNKELEQKNNQKQAHVLQLQTTMQGLQRELLALKEKNCSEIATNTKLQNQMADEQNQMNFQIQKLQSELLEAQDQIEHLNTKLLGKYDEITAITSEKDSTMETLNSQVEFWKNKYHKQKNFQHKEEKKAIEEIMEKAIQLELRVNENVKILEEEQRNFGVISDNFKQLVQIKKSEVEEIRQEYETQFATAIAEKEELKNRIEVLIAQQKKIIANPEKIQIPNKKAMKGNPIQDMSEQIEANKIRIEVLSQENVRLQATIGKLKQMSF